MFPAEPKLVELGGVLFGNAAALQMAIEDGADATLDLTIARGQAAPHVNKYGETYRDPAKYR